jgi:hypothetical protein
MRITRFVLGGRRDLRLLQLLAGRGHALLRNAAGAPAAGTEARPPELISSRGWRIIGAPRPSRLSSSSRSLISKRCTGASPGGRAPGSWMNAPVAADPVTTGWTIVLSVGRGGCAGGLRGRRLCGRANTASTGNTVGAGTLPAPAAVAAMLSLDGAGGGARGGGEQTARDAAPAGR